MILFVTINNSEAQIVVTGDGSSTPYKVGLGNGMTTPGYAIDILGTTRIRPSSGGNYMIIQYDSNQVGPLIQILTTRVL